MILVTGAAGKTGRAVIQALIAGDQKVRGLVHRNEQVGSLKQLGVEEVIVGDMSVENVITSAARGTRAIYHIAPNMHQQEKLVGQIAIEAGQSAGVEHFVYHSVLHPQIEAMPHHWQKLRVEERLFASGLPYTILQPAPYMQNILAYWSTILDRSVISFPYAAETRLSMVDLQDVAKVAAIVLTEPGHLGATYELSGSEVLSQNEVAGIIGQKLHRSVQPEVVSLKIWQEKARASGLGDYQVETPLKMFQYYERNGFLGNSKVLESLLGHAPTTFPEFVARIIREKF